jgi:hypothetical protein
LRSQFSSERAGAVLLRGLQVITIAPCSVATLFGARQACERTTRR